MMIDSTVTVREFAKKFKLTRQGVIDRIHRGVLVATLIKGRWLIPKEELKNHKRMRFGTRYYLVRR